MASRVASPLAVCGSMTPLRKRFSPWSALALLRRPLPPRKRPSQRRDQVREALKRDLEAARYAADRAFRQYDAADPANRLVAGELEARWNKALARVAEVEGKIAAHDAATVAPTADPRSLATLAADLKTVWTAPSTDARLKKRIVRTVIHEVIADIDAGGSRDRSARPLGRRRSQRDTPAQTAARTTQQHLSRCDCRGTPTGADRQRRSHRRHPEQERIGDRLWQSLDARARHLAALASSHRRLQAGRRRNRTVAEPQQGRATSPCRAPNAQAGGGGWRDRGASSFAGRSLDLQPRRSLRSHRHVPSPNAHARTQSTPRDRIPISKACSLQ